MRTKILTVATVGVLALSGVAVAGPVLATVGATEAAEAVSERVDRVKQALAGLVTDGTLTQQQADRVAETLGNAELGEGRHHGGAGHGLGRRGLDLDAAATALGLTSEELRTELREGKTLAQVAEERDVPVETLTDALVAAAETALRQAVEEGRLTQEQADERRADLEARLSAKIESGSPWGGGHRGGGHRPGPG